MTRVGFTRPLSFTALSRDALVQDERKLTRSPLLGIEVEESICSRYLAMHWCEACSECHEGELSWRWISVRSNCGSWHFSVAIERCFSFIKPAKTFTLQLPSGFSASLRVPSRRR